MSEEKPTFRYRRTGEEIESTPLARLVVGLVFGLLGGVVGGLWGGVRAWLYGYPREVLICGLTLGMFYGLLLFAGAYGWSFRPNKRFDFKEKSAILAFGLPFVVGLVVLMQHFEWHSSLCFSLLCGLIWGLVFGLGQKIHHGVARRQHLRRQRILKRRLLEEEWAGVPDGALSRAGPPGEPQPTQASLSRAEASEEESPRLTASVEAGTEETSVVAAEEML